MFLLKDGDFVVTESNEPIVYSEQEKAWFVIEPTQTIWYVNNPQSWTVEEQAPNLDGGPNVIG